MKVIVYEVHSITIEVPATDRAEATIQAEQIIETSDELLTEYSHTMDSDDWTYINDKGFVVKD